MSETHRWVVDALAETMASIEVDGDAVIDVPRWLLPGSAREGDVLRVTHERPASSPRATLTVEVDADAKKSALAESSAQVAKAKAKSKVRDPGGDIAL